MSPSYIQSLECLNEWNWIKDKEESQYILIGVHPLDNELFLTQLNNEENEFLNQFSNKLSARLYKEEDDDNWISSITKNITTKLAYVYTKKGRNFRQSNLHYDFSFIDDINSKDDYKKLYQEVTSEQNSFGEDKPVCLIYTGGTVGMIEDRRIKTNNKYGYKQSDDISVIINHLPALNNLSFDVHFLSFRTPIDSSSISEDHWNKLGSIIERLYSEYQGFVILHGSNTISYTASMLSFFFDALDKPIILTGAELPLVQWKTDADQNVIEALKLAAPLSKDGQLNIKEVAILYGRYLLRGNRSKKNNTLNTLAAFESPNYEPLGIIENAKVSINRRFLRTAAHGDDIISFQKIEEGNVIIIYLSPGMKIEWYKRLFDGNSQIKAVVLQSYGSGNTPNSKGFIRFIKKLIDRNIIVVNTTQCNVGSVMLQLYENNATLFDMGVINGGDMTLEAAYCKLKYLLAQNTPDRAENIELIKSEFQRDLRGELSISTYSIEFKGVDEFVNMLTTNSVQHSSAVAFERLEIENAFLRIQAMDVKTMQDEIIFKLFYNREKVKFGDEDSKDNYYKLVEFSKKADSADSMFFNINLDITHGLRKFYSPQNSKVHIISNSDFKFEILHMIINIKRL